MDYKRKLIEFNSTDKYARELDFLFSLLQLKKNQNVLDFGCGTGRAVRKFRNDSDANVFGYDVENYLETEDEYMFRKDYHFQFDKIYFMHSFAHIMDPLRAVDLVSMDGLKRGGRVYIITPNRYWLEQNRKPDYVPEPTVLKHYSLSELEHIFSVNGFEIINSGQFGTSRLEINERLFLIAEKK